MSGVVSALAPLAEATANIANAIQINIVEGEIDAALIAKASVSLEASLREEIAVPKTLLNIGNVPWITNR